MPSEGAKRGRQQLGPWWVSNDLAERFHELVERRKAFQRDVAEEMVAEFLDRAEAAPAQEATP